MRETIERSDLDAVVPFEVREYDVMRGSDLCLKKSVVPRHEHVDVAK